MFTPSFPLHFVFILGNRCNLACTHCSSNADARSSAGFSTSEARDVLTQMADMGVVDVAFSGGEPLLRRDLEGLVAFAKELGLSTGTSTNGYALIKRRAFSLKASGLDRLQISLDGTRSAHERIRGPGSFDKAITAIQRSVEAGLRTHICFTAMRTNAHLFPEMIELAATLGVDGFNLSQFVPTGRGSIAEGLKPAAAKDLLKAWLAAKRRYPDLHLTAHSSGLAALTPSADDCRGGCQAGLSIGCITAHGDVTPCVMFPLPLGNLRNEQLRAIWSRSATIATLRSREVKGRCGNCRYRSSCGGCRAAAWAVSGDMMAEDPYCWMPSHTSATEASTNM
jgi:radical SAM protein with 4Fe4S-binding SPASM domain